MNDNHDDNLLSPLKELNPSNIQMQKWKQAVAEHAKLPPNAKAKEKSHFVSKFKLPLQLVAAMLVGLILGMTLAKQLNPATGTDEWRQELSQHATFERTRTNLN